MFSTLPPKEYSDGKTLDDYAVSFRRQITEKELDKLTEAEDYMRQQPDEENLFHHPLAFLLDTRHYSRIHRNASR